MRGRLHSGQPLAKLGWWEGLPEVSWAVSASSMGLVDADSLTEPERNVCLKTRPLTNGSPGLLHVWAADTKVACGLRSPQMFSHLYW